ncbi:hypothetical protein OSB04_024054 [Centaurea solstitialis]|uniref:CCHC-type domain-containing protein n=1 Tax=Centaurea solstitialis TaxID=347529 RepID=A0AA38T3U9_9ASTR|nr:hypothetical protein OSB04_024054 [Centaurea solstitialis]
MSRDLLSMGSKSKPPVLQIGEYLQWRVRMIQFLNNIDKTLMLEKIRAKLDDKALTFLMMAIPDDLFNRVDSRDTTKELWDELEKQFQGTERSIQAKLNQAIGAYKGFKALEGETLADSYSRFNIILNDLRRNGMHKSTSEINFKFLKNLNSEWDHYLVNLQMNKNLAEEDIHDLYSILSRHEVKVKDIVTKQKTIADSLALLTEKKKSVLSSASSKKKSHSKALVTELSDSDSETIEDESSESDVDLKKVADKLALLSSSIHKRYGKKKFYSKPKFDNYKRDKYKPKEYEKRPERKSYEKDKTDEKGNVCFNCGKPDHFVKDCKVPKVRDFDYYTKKAQLARCKSEGKVLMAEEECWYDDTSDDEDSAHFTQVHYNLMASVEETINLHKETEVTNEVSQTPFDSDLSDNDESSLEEQFLNLKTEFDDLKEKIKFERARVIEFSNECELYKCLVDDRELEKVEIRKKKAKLESQISEKKSALKRSLFSNESEYFPKEIEGESKTTESAPKSDEQTSELEKEKDCENLSNFIQVNNFSENKSASDYESESDSDETKPCFDSDNDDDIEAGVEEEKINFISIPMFESQDTPPCFDQGIKPEVTDSITYAIIDKDGYLVYKSLDSMVEGDILKSELKLPGVEFGHVFEKSKSGTQDKPNVVNVSSDSGISKDLKSSCPLSKSETCSINFDASTIEVGSTSCATLETSSKYSSNVCSVPKTPINSSSSDSTDLKTFKRHGLGWKKKDSNKKEKSFATNESFVKKSSFYDANKCNKNVSSNKCQNSFESDLLALAMNHLQCTPCGDNSFSLNSRHVKKKRSRGVSRDKSHAYSFDHHAKVFSAKKKNLSKARHMWYVDSGCSRHMTGYKELLHNFVELPGGIVSFGNKTTCVIKGYGILINDKVSIKKVLYIEGLSDNLFSASQFCDGYNLVLFSIINCLIINSDGVESFEGRRYYNLYVVDFPVLDSPKPVCLFSKATKGESWLWHRRFSHQNFSNISKLANGGLVKGLPKLTFDGDSLCPACQMGKMKRSSHKSKTESSCKSPLKMIHMDLCGPMRIQSINGKKYILVMLLTLRNKMELWKDGIEQHPSTAEILFRTSLLPLAGTATLDAHLLLASRSVQLSYSSSDFQFLKIITSLSASVNLRSFSSSTKMSRDLLSMGSKSKPPVLQIGEYPQWRVRMIQFLNNIDKTLMTSIQEGPIKPFIDIPGTPETATTPAIEPRRVYKLFRHYNELEKIRAEIDDKALTFLTMAIPNDLFNRVDSRKTAKELWDELEKQFQGTERSIQAKLNQAIGAYEGFKALEGETIADSYSRFNIILNDLRRNGMHKSTSEINFKFLKNLNSEWDHYSVNLQMNKNLAEEDLHDLYSILSQHEVKVKDIVMKQKSISDSLALLTEKSKSVLSSGSKKKSHSKALVTELSDSDSETVEDDSSESDVDLKRVADKLALLSSSIHKRYGKKKFYSKPKFENYKRDKYKPKKYERRPERKTYEKGMTDEKGNVCFNCGKPGHFVKDCRAPKVRDFDYYSKKAQLAKRKSEGKVLMAEEECWYDDTSDDEDSAHFTQVHYNLMASVEETINLHKVTETSNEVSQTPSDSDISDNDEYSLEEQFLILKAEFDDLKEKIKFERARVIEFSNECELYKSLADDRELEKAEIRKEKAKLESQISEMKSALVNLESEKAEYMIKYEVCFQDRS